MRCVEYLQRRQVYTIGDLKRLREDDVWEYRRMFKNEDRECFEHFIDISVLASSDETTLESILPGHISQKFVESSTGVGRMETAFESKMRLFGCKKPEDFDVWEIIITDSAIWGLRRDGSCPEITSVGVDPHSSEIVLHVKDTLNASQFEDYVACARSKCIGIDGFRIVRGPDYGEAIELQGVIKTKLVCLPCYCICGSFKCLISCAPLLCSVCGA